MAIWRTLQGIAASAAAVFLASGCGGGGGEASRAAPAVVVGVTPATASVAAGAVQVFKATVSGTSNTSVTCRVAEGDSGGRIESVTSAGYEGATSVSYRAPSAAGTYHVYVTSQADSNKSVTATVNVTANNSWSQMIQPSSTFAAATNAIAPSVYLVYFSTQSASWVATSFAVQFQNDLEFVTAGHVTNDLAGVAGDPTLRAWVLQTEPNGDLLGFPITARSTDSRYDPGATSTVDLGYLWVGPGQRWPASGGPSSPVAAPPTTARIASSSMLSGVQTYQALGVLGYPGNLTFQIGVDAFGYPTFQPEKLLKWMPIPGSAAHCISYDLPSTQGFSGGPVFLPDGQAIAVNVALARIGIGESYVGIGVYLDALWTRSRSLEQDRKLLPVRPLPPDWRERLAHAKFL